MILKGPKRPLEFPREPPASARAGARRRWFSGEGSPPSGAGPMLLPMIIPPIPVALHLIVATIRVGEYFATLDQRNATPRPDAPRTPYCRPW